MKKLFAISIMALFLAGCDEARHARDKALIDSRLPSGCEMKALGNYGSQPVVAVICDGRNTTSSNTRRTSGKSTYNETTVTIGEK